MSSYLGYLNIPKEIISDCFSFMVDSCKSATANTVITPKMDLSIVVNQYNFSPWIKVAALTGAASVCLGAYGAHGLKDVSKRQIFETANKYHFYHSLALLAMPFLQRPNIVGSLFLGGILIFCGTCYCNAITDNTQVIKFTPIGGFMFILGWLAILL